MYVGVSSTKLKLIKKTSYISFFVKKPLEVTGNFKMVNLCFWNVYYHIKGTQIGAHLMYTSYNLFNLMIFRSYNLTSDLLYSDVKMKKSEAVINILY